MLKRIILVAFTVAGLVILAPTPANAFLETIIAAAKYVAAVEKAVLAATEAAIAAKLAEEAASAAEAARQAAN